MIFFGLLADKSTDESLREQLGFIVRCKIKEIPGYKDGFLELINLISVNAESITDWMEKFRIAKGNIINCHFLALGGANGHDWGYFRGIVKDSTSLTTLHLYCRNQTGTNFCSLIEKT